MDQAAAPRRWRFGGCTLDESSLELTVDGAPVQIERKPRQVLRHLLRHAGEVVTKDELLAAVWPGRILSDSAVAKAVSRLREACRETDESPFIRCVYGTGYRLVVDVAVEERAVDVTVEEPFTPAPAAPGSEPAAAAEALPLPLPPTLPAAGAARVPARFPRALAAALLAAVALGGWVSRNPVAAYSDLRRMMAEATSPARPGPGSADDAIQRQVIEASIASYPGPCACPYSTDRAGHRCGRRSAYSRPRGFVLQCYAGDVTPQAVEAYRKRDGYGPGRVPRRS